MELLFKPLASHSKKSDRNFLLRKKVIHVSKKIVINIARQHLTAYENSKEVFSFPCVSGDATHPTPMGKFRIMKKDKIHRSIKYNAQMNYAMQITSDGVYIHEAYNYVEIPLQQTVVATLVSDTALNVFSRGRVLFPKIAELNVGIGKINLTGSHGCVRLAHSDAVRLFDWAEIKTPIEIG